MQRYLIIAFFIILICPKLYAQSYTISGQIIDTLNYKNLQYGTATLIRQSDSTLNTFTRTDEKGKFVLHPDSIGKYKLILSFPNFADYTDIIMVKDATPIDIGAITMLSRKQLLSEFVLRQRQGTIVIKGDTTEYAADSFKVHDNATVEDLLRKMPGLQIDKNGGITAQGEKVQKVLVDGEELFSDDPAVVTQNLDAKAVAAVQVYDKKSDEALFTGIEDGEKQKTINLKLKEDRKKGFFGKTELGAGTDQFYQGQGMVNAFKGKRQISAFGIGANTGKMGLGWQDQNKYSSSGSRVFDEDNGYMYYTSSSDDESMTSWDGNYNGEGIPHALTGGLHYNNKYNEGKEEIGGNYRYAQQDISAQGNTVTQYALADTVYNTNQTRHSNSFGKRHAANANFEWKPDTTSQIVVNADAGYSNTHSNTFSATTTTRGLNQSPVNESFRTLIGDATTRKLNASLNYKKKFKKKGRNMSLSFSENWNENDGNSTLTSGNTYFTTATKDSVNQLKENNTTTLSLSGTASYTEPLTKELFLTGSYGLGVQNNQSSRFSYDKQPGGEWNNIPNDTFSSNFDFDIFTQTARASLRYVHKKYNISLGSAAFFTTFKQKDLIRNVNSNRSYQNFSPSATLTYNFSKQKRISFNYYGNTRQPTMVQLQPLQQNTDPLNISTGNPNLKQQFQNNMSLNWNNYKVMSGEHYYFSGNFGFINDAITLSQSIDENGKRTYQYINTNGNLNSSVYFGAGRKIAALNIYVGISVDADYRKSKNFVNGHENISQNGNYGISFNIGKDWEKDEKSIASFNIEPSFNWYDNKATISQYTTSYWMAGLDIRSNLELPLNLRLNSSLSALLRQKTEVFSTNNNVFLWNAYVAKKLGKTKKSEVRLSVNDILNQNIGFQRTASDNIITQNSYNTIRRFGMLTFVWNFANKAGKTTNKSDDDDD